MTKERGIKKKQIKERDERKKMNPDKMKRKM